MKRKFLPVLLILLLAGAVYSQTAPANLLEKLDLQFTLGGDEKPEEAEFYNENTSWKLQYELMLTDSQTLEKLGKCFRSEFNRFVCRLNEDKKTDRAIRKNSISIAKGKIKRKGLSDEKEREVSIPINLNSETITTFNEAAGDVERNPTLVLFIKSKAATKNSAGRKFKSKLATMVIYPLKNSATTDAKNFNDLKLLTTKFWIR